MGPSGHAVEEYFDLVAVGPHCGDPSSDVVVAHLGQRAGQARLEPRCHVAKADLVLAAGNGLECLSDEW